MSEVNAPRRSTGGTLDADVTDGILDATLAELASVGYGKLSMDGVARRARSGKAALYRRWSSKQEMVLEAMARVSVPAVESPGTGHITAEVAGIIRGVDAWIGDPLMSRILPDLLAEAKRNTGLAEAMNERLAARRRDSGRAVIEAAIGRGEVKADVDVEYALDLMAGPIFWRICGLRQDSTPEFLDRVVDTVLHALGLESRDWIRFSG